MAVPVFLVAFALTIWSACQEANGMPRRPADSQTQIPGLTMDDPQVAEIQAKVSASFLQDPQRAVMRTVQNTHWHRQRILAEKAKRENGVSPIGMKLPVQDYRVEHG